MVHQVILPRLGTNIDEGTIVEWKKSAGDIVRAGEVLLEVETSKSIFEVESEHNGFLREILHGEDSEVLFTKPVAIIADSLEEDISGWNDNTASDEGAAVRYADSKREELHKHAPKDNAVVAGAIPEVADAIAGVESGTVNRVVATPAAKRRMREAGISAGRFARAGGHSVMNEADVLEGIKEKAVAIYGAGLGAKQVLELLRSNGGLTAAVLYDDDPELKGKVVLGLPVRGGWTELLEDADRGEALPVAVSLHSEYRRRLIEKIRELAPSVVLRALVDKRAIVSEGVVISDGAIVEAGSIIGPDTFIGEGVIVDVGVVIAHDCHIGAHTHLSPGCTLSGVVKIEDNVLVGVGASINSQVVIGRNTVITPGTAVVTDLSADVVVSGNPARTIGRSFRGR